MTLATTRLGLRRIGGRIGAEITGVDLAEPLDEATIAELNTARLTRHYAADDYGDLPRRLHRVTAAGDVPAGVDGRHSYVLEGDEAGHYTPKAV
jgi:alpha-ketoglutarate-dependent taurine dioxygenase